MCFSSKALIAAVVTAIAMPPPVALSAPVKVRYEEGSEHGFLALRTLDGKLLASGDLVQTLVHGRLIARLVYRFKDGSIDDEHAVFKQDGNFHLLSDHLVQTGPSFPRATDLTIDVPAQTVTVRTTVGGKLTVTSSHMSLPDDLANGIILMLIKNLPTHARGTEVSYLAATPNPTIVRLSITGDGTDGFTSAGLRNTAQRFRVHVEIGGLKGILAAVLGRKPEDSFVWISGKEVPAFIKAEGPLYVGGPTLRTELIGPVWSSR
jgi:hypothetical protein